jgi:integrase
MHKRLTDKFVAGVKAPTETAQVDYFDLGHPALALRVGHREKTFTFHYRDQGKLKRMKLGRYPEMTLAEAREVWRLARKALAEGTLSKPAAPSHTADTVLTQYFEAWKRDKRPNSVKAVERQLHSYVLPAWHGREIASITKHDVLSLLDSLTQRGAVTQARRVFATLATLFKWCVKRDVISVNPMAGIERKDIGSEQSRERVLSDAELSKLVTYLRGSNQYDPHVSATHLLILTGCRTEEIAALRWDEINGDMIEIPGERMKNGDAFDLPITTHIRAILNQVPRLHDCPFVFSSNGKKPIGGWDKFKKRLDAATGLNGWQFRDLRRTMQTGLQKLGFSDEVIDACVAHKKAGVRKVYLRHKYADEKRVALEAWGTSIGRLRG